MGEDRISRSDREICAMTAANLKHYHWILRDALTHAAHVAARAQEATEGCDSTLLFDAARKAIGEFRDDHPAMRALATAAVKNRT